MAGARGQGNGKGPEAPSSNGSTQGGWNLVVRASRRWRRQALFVILATDYVAWSLAVLVAGVARLDFTLTAVTWSGIFGAMLFGMAAMSVIGVAAGLYWHRHPVATHGEFRSLALTVFLVGLATSFVYAPAMQYLNVTTPRSLGVLSAPLALFFMAAVRSVWRTADERTRRSDPEATDRMIVFGAGEAGQQIVRSLQRDPDAPLIPVAVLDDDERVHNRRVHGLMIVGGIDEIASAAERFQASVLLIAIASADAARVRDIVRRAEAAGLDVKVLPPVSEIVDGRVSTADIRELTITDLLQREQAELDIDAICEYVQGRRVLVTGAGGSIGSELCRQLMRFGPRSLAMLDRDESALLSLQLSIDGKGQMAGRDLVLADLRDVERMHEVFAEHRPEVVFHAAALKHVPLLENNPAEGLKTNAIGTLNVLEASAAVGVRQFVNISTDKAADPENVLGYSKRIAERLTAAMDQRADGNYKSVRFGNVLGSRGSVLTTFEEQIRNGGPITVTDPEVTRYFMSVTEAVRLVIQAGAVGSNGEILVLDMGEPVRIVELAQQLINASPRSIDIVFTGLRPGERLHEVLFAPDEEGVQRSHPKIWHTDVLALECSRDDLTSAASAPDVLNRLRDFAGRDVTVPVTR